MLSAALPPIVFLLGNHRSGTTWLYQLLAQTGCFSVLTAWDVIEWDRVLTGTAPPREELGRRMIEAGITARQVDGVAITPDLPEEYCYILSNAGLGSALTSRNLPLFERLLVHLAAARPDRPILLKNPWDYANFTFLADSFPEARFLFLHRHPLKVTHSSVAVTCALWGGRPADPYVLMLSRRYARWRRSRISSAFFHWLTTGSTRLFSRSVAFGVSAANKGYVARLPALPGRRWAELRYEDLAARPDEELSRIVSFLGVEPLSGIQTPSRPASSGLRPEVEALAASLHRSMPEYYARMSYGERP
jgi:hypothetical protein